MITTKVLHCETDDCYHHNNKSQPIVQIVFIGKVVVNTTQIVSIKQPKYYVILNDEYQIITAYWTSELSHLIDQKQVTVYDLIKVTKWMPQNESQVIIEDAQLVQKCDHILGSPKPHWYQPPTYYQMNYNLIDFLWSPDTMRDRVILPCGCTCRHKRKSIVYDRENFIFDNKDNGTNLDKVMELVQDTFKEIKIARSEISNTHRSCLDSADHGWQYCTQCAFEFVLPDNMKKIICCIKQELNRTDNGDNIILSTLIFKLTHYPMIFRSAFKKHYKLFIKYWIDGYLKTFTTEPLALIQDEAFMQSDSGPTVQKYQIIVANMIYRSWINSKQYFLLRLFEMGYIKRKHMNFIMKTNPDIFSDLIIMLRTKYIKVAVNSCFMQLRETQKGDSIELDFAYRLLLNFVVFWIKDEKIMDGILDKRVTMSIINSYIGFLCEETDPFTDYSLMLKFGQKYIFDIMDMLRGNKAHIYRRKIRKSQRICRKIGNECQNPKCHRSDLKLKICSQCKMVNYCSIKCQKLDWNVFGHRTRCKLFQ